MADISYYGQAPDPQGNGRKKFEQTLDLLYRRRWIVISTFLLVAVGTAIYALTRPPEYRAQSVVVVNLARTHAPQQMMGIDAGDNFFARNDRTLAGELFLIRSSYTVSQRVNERLREAVARQDSTAEHRLSYPPRGTVNSGQATRDANAISVVGISTDPYEAALLANLYAEEYVRLTQVASRTYMSQSREFLEDQLEAQRAELNRAEKQLKRYQERTGIRSLGQGTGNLVTQVRSMQAQ